MKQKLPLKDQSQRTLASWLWLAKTSIRNINEEQALRIAEHALQDAQTNPQACVWHSSSAVFGQQCNCMKCRKEMR